MKGLTFDMVRCPEKVIAVQQKIITFMINTAKGFYSRNPAPLSFGALHRGSDDFMSLRQFEKFYWPGLKQVMLAVIDAGIRPFMFFEGFWDQRLEYLKELPRGKVVGWFDRTDLFKAKKIIGNHLRICGGMPLSLLQTGTVQQVADYTKKLIDELAPDGGYIMGTITELDFARPELVKVWADVTREYGIYR